MELFNHLIIETAGACNRTCGSCLRQTHPKREGTVIPLLRTVQHKPGRSELMPQELFVKIVGEAAELGFKGRVTLQFFNEPLLDERLVDLAEHVRVMLPQSPLWMCSNMDLMTKELAARLDGVLNRINVALYMPADKQSARERLLRSWFSKTNLFFTQGVHVVTHHSPSEQLSELISKVIDQTCRHYNRMLIVNWDGSISHCCEDVAAEFALGNLADMSVSDFWFGERNKHLVSTLSQPGGRREFDYCSSCPREGSGGLEARAARVEQIRLV